MKKLSLILVGISLTFLLETVKALECLDEALQCAYNSKEVCRKFRGVSWERETTKNGDSCVNWKKTVSPKHGNGSRCVATDGYGPWCYTDAFSITWDYCFEDCNDACVHKNQQCADNQKDKCQHFNSYQGTKQQTKNGAACLPWKETNFTMMGEKNFCRASEGWGPWCVVSKKGDWDLCFDNCEDGCTTNDGEVCAHNQDFGACRVNGAYNGPKTTTADGVDCINWKDSPRPRLGDNRRCFSTFGFAPWCYTDSKGAWEYCFPTCEADHKCVLRGESCAQNANAVCMRHDSYKGQRSQTIDGVPCLPWEKSDRYAFIYNASSSCRSTYGWAPWCRTSDKGDWGFCFRHCEDPACINTARNCAYNDDDKCKSTGVYGGDLSAPTSTWKGVPCKNWLETGYTANGDNNRCQSTAGWGPWCFTDDGWDYCFQTCKPDEARI